MSHRQKYQNQRNQNHQSAENNERQVSRKNHRKDGSNRDEQISKTLSYILRHHAAELGLQIRADGFVVLDELLKSQPMERFHSNLDEIKHIVDTNDKKRYSLILENDIYLIRANQGHSSHVEVKTEELLKLVEDAKELPLCVHGSYWHHWESIAKTGLNRMKRKHIHFSRHLLGSSDVVSGMRSSCDLMIYIDVESAMKDGIKFFISSNDVVLTEGFNGVLPSKYFSKVERFHRKDLRVEDVTRTIQKIVFKSKPLKYILILDFEATCDDANECKIPFEPQEVIEWPTLLLNCETKQVEAVFHHYIKPEKRPQLTPFCTNLTGITQDQVEQGIPFAQAFHQFHQFLVHHRLIDEQGRPSDDNTFAFLTCGDWDLKTMLPKQCELIGKPTPSFMKQWINIKFAVQKHYHVKVGGMVSILQFFKLDLQGRHHSGIDDCRNIARCCIAMLKDNVRFDMTSRIKE